MGTDNVLSVIDTIICLLIYFASILKSGMLFFRIRSKKLEIFIYFVVIFLIIAFCGIDNYLITSIIRQALIILFFCIVFQGEKWQKLSLSAVLVSIWEFIWNAALSILGLCILSLRNNSLIYYGNETSSFITLTVYFLIALFICFLFNKTKLSKGNFLYGGKLLFFSMSLLLVLIDICNYGITQGVTMVSDSSGVQNWNATYNEMFTHIEVLILSLLCLLICLPLLFGINKLISYVTTDRLHKMEISRYQTMLTQYKSQTNVRHDMKNHLISMVTLAEHEEWGKLKEYLLKVYNTDIFGEAEIETGNNIVNAIVNIKRHAAEKSGIKFDCEINISRPLSIDDYDLCVVWGNILDNAVSAASMATEEKYVYVQAEIVKRNLVINVKNGVRKNTLPEKFEVQSFGTGLMNVRKIVEKENGIMDIEIKDKVFEISVMLPIVI